MLPALPTVVVDTTAAGDAFNGAFATAMAEGKSAVDAARFAIAAAGISVSRHGAQASMASRRDIDALQHDRSVQDSSSVAPARP
jgi:ribokinase